MYYEFDDDEVEEILKDIGSFISKINLIIFKCFVLSFCRYIVFCF